MQWCTLGFNSGGGEGLSVTPYWGVGVGGRGTLLVWSAEALALI